jgi:predicted membrane protein
MIFGPAKDGHRFFRKPMFAHTEGNENFFEDIAIFGGGERRILTQTFKGGQLVAMFGGSKIDLIHSNIASGDKPVIEVVCIFGGSTLLVPSDWNVRVEVFNIFGGYVDKRITSQVDFNKTLIIKGVTIFGGGEVKSY